MRIKFRLKRLSVVLGVVVVTALALIGLLTVTRGTPVRSVRTLGGGGAPSVTDSLFEQTIELFTGTHMFAGNNVWQLLNGDGTYPPLWADQIGRASCRERV